MIQPVVLTARPGVNREQLRQTLSDLQAAAGNLRSTHTAGERFSAYLAWVANAVRVLRGQVSAADLDRLVLTRRCWLLQSKADGWTATLAHLLDTEIDERTAALEDAVRALDEQLERWSRPGWFIVADSSFYLRHPDKLEQADLAAVLGARGDPLHLILPIVVVDELDGLKQAGQPHVRWRAGYTLAVLDRVLRDGTGPARLRDEDFTAIDTGGIPRGEITVEVLLDPPGHRRLPINDDEIVDRALAIQPLAGRTVTLLTYDTGQATRARSAGLQVRKLTLPLEDEPTAQARPPRQPPRP
jgi:hypothetical protein